MFRLQHSHPDGTTHDMERIHHDPAEHGPERAWQAGHVYRCTGCDETAAVVRPDQQP
jgi:hypothetical protein